MTSTMIPATVKIPFFLIKMSNLELSAIFNYFNRYCKSAAFKCGGVRQLLSLNECFEYEPSAVYESVEKWFESFPVLEFVLEDFSLYTWTPQNYLI